MTKDEHILYWLELAEDDLVSSKINLENNRYNWSLFIGHLVIEKVLKALFVQNNDNILPPKTHDLIKLAKMSNVTADDNLLEFLFILNQFNLEARYPDYKEKISKISNKEYASNVFIKVNEVFNWLKSLIILKK